MRQVFVAADLKGLYSTRIHMGPPTKLQSKQARQHLLRWAETAACFPIAAEKGAEQALKQASTYV